MKISYNWLREYVKTDLTASRIAEILTSTGLEVEALEKIETLRGGLEGVVVGHVLTCEKHPDADKLSVTTVDAGTGEALQIVCGAPNVAAGQKVPVAMIGAVLYPTGEEDGFKIKRSKIRGVESLGMICAEDELGMGTNHDGIMLLDSSLKPGTPMRDVLGIEDDFMLEIGLTPNRIDAGSHLGVARDLAAWLRSNGTPTLLDLPSVEAFHAGNTEHVTMVTVENPEAAPRYSGLTMTGIKIAPSPSWLQKRLLAIGINPKNNVVDITNFILHELGQPLHAFDADKIKGDRIVVCTCPEGTSFTTLDGVERKLSAEDLMICNAHEPMCIAGVFGGLDAGVSDATTSIFIESAYFNPVWVRKTAKRHGLNTDSSFRFERGTDPDMTVYALKRAALLVEELAGGKVSSGVTDLYPAPIEPFRFDISLARVNALIGKEIPAETVRAIIHALDIKVEKDAGDVLSVAVPPYRVDVQREADLIEDILRVYGYNNVEVPQSVKSTLAYAPKPDRDRLQNLLSDTLTAQGFNEIMSNSLTRSAYYEGLQSYPAENCVRILNPLSNDLNVMRQTLVFNALEAVQLNVNHRRPDLKFYEVGNCYRYDATKKDEGGLAPYSETKRLALAMTGNFAAGSWNVKGEAVTFFHLRASVEKLFARLGLDIYRLQCRDLESDLFAQAVSLGQGEAQLVQMGVIAPKLAAAFDLKAPVYYAEIDFDALVKATRKNSVAARDLPRFPEVRRDLALLVDSGVTFGQLRAEAFAAERKLLTNVTLFDVYEGDNLPAGKKSYALGFTLLDPERTLTDQAIDAAMANIVKRFEKIGASLRS
ncbi:MAG: phenylalanine--tRNA ligase subunit beta [Rikenellaceae bacterium]|jgi:phenylalanyl-tRNA synthetase beta chain|nr:phenylalanine--tRNA ligase subunit beta [Rikenellaceae bacterium]